MFQSFRSLRIVVFFAASCLFLNDMARLVFPGIQQMLIEQVSKKKEQDDNNSVGGFSFLEEEVKHAIKDRLHHFWVSDGDLGAAAAHLIKDDDVRHLAFIPIFTPPPDPA